MSSYYTVKKSRFKKSVQLLERLGYLPKLNEAELVHILGRMMDLDQKIISKKRGERHESVRENVN
ncbi:MAG: hypothetical protein ACOX30_07125 [Dethiobacteria bacterium]|jgi:hypothetical protein